MKYRVIILAMVAALSLPAIAQFGNTDPFTATAPTATFQSTSAMVGSGSDYSSNPTIGDDGTATQPNASPKVRAISGRRNDTPDDDDDEGLLPIGDALLPLMLLAVGYIAVRRRAES